MIATIRPMLAEPSVIGLLVVLALLLAVIAIPSALVSLVLLLRRTNSARKNPPAANAAPSAVRQNLLWIVPALLALTALATVIILKSDAKKNQTDDHLTPAEFYQAVDSNRIVEATIFGDRQSPFFEVRGTYKRQDNAGTVARFVTPKMSITVRELDKLMSLPKVQESIAENHSAWISTVIILLAGALIFVIAVVSIIVGLVSAAKRFAPRAPPPAPPAAPIHPQPRKCPKCGAILKPDAPEGLCPACLLQHGIATEGGAPPGTPAFTPPPLLELAKLFPQLEILEIIGQGGMGAVYKARQPSLDRFVALKILAPRSGGDLDFAGRFSREARALARLSHPNIVAVYDFGQLQRAATAEPRPSPLTPEMLSYFIMEYVDGPNLRQVEQAGKLTPREALQIIPQICAALQFAHDEGIVHRDIKPENVLLDKKGRVKIADFGLAKILGQEADFRLTGARDVMGTPHYMAPEQVEKPQEVDHRADIYSLGVVFYEMLTGELPLGKFDPPSHKVQIDVRLDDVVLRSLANNPDRRYQQVSEVKTELDSIAQTPPKFTANPANQAANNRPRSSSWIGWAIFAAAIIALPIIIMVGFVPFFWQRHVVSTPQPPQPVAAYNAGTIAPNVLPTPNDGVDFHCRVFDCDAVTVDGLISTEKRNSVTNPFPHSTTRTSFAIIDTNTFATLTKSVIPPNFLVDSHTNVSRASYQSVLLMNSPSEKFAGESWRRNFMANGFLGMHHDGLNLQIKIDLNSVNYSLFPVRAGVARPVMLNPRLFYEGNAPGDEVLVFLIFFTMPDRTDHYLIVAFETDDWFTRKTDSNSGTTALERTDGEQAFIRITKFSESPSTPEISFLAIVPSGYALKASNSDGGFSSCSNTGSDPDSYRAYFPGIDQVRPFRPGQRAARTQPIPFITPEKLAVERQSLKSQLHALQDQGLISIVAGQPKLLFSITNGAGDVGQAFLELVPAETNSSFPAPVQPPQPVLPAPLPTNIIRPLRTLPPNRTLSPEEQVAIIEMQRLKAQQESNPISRILPPTLLSPSNNSTNGLPSSTPRTPEGILHTNTN
jgi:serine/threonine protein kinase